MVWMEQSGREQSEFHGFFDAIEGLLVVTYDHLEGLPGGDAADAADAADGRLVDLRTTLEGALRVFRRWSMKPEKCTRRDKEFTMQDVDDVCAYVMEAMALVQTTDSVCSVALANLRVVLRTAQRMFANIDKQITVRVVQIAAGARTEHAATPHTINGDHTVQGAVRQAYAAFPGACLRVVRRRGVIARLPLWDRTPHGCAFFSRDKYDMLQAGDEIDIEVEDVRPDGAEAAPAERVPWGAFGGGPDEYERRPAGAQAGLVGDWLHQLQALQYG